MVRKRTQKKLTDIVLASAETFIESGGYRRTQMEDIAKRAGVSKGTLYLYAESKEALFDLAVRFSDAREGLPGPEAFPVQSPEPGATVDYITTRLATDKEFMGLAELIHSGPDDPILQLAKVARGLYRVLNNNRYALKLIDTCASDHPELAALWFTIGRGGVTDLLVPYLEQRIADKVFMNVPDVKLAARFILESCMLWAVHMYWDPHPESLAEDKIEDTLVHFVLCGLIRP